MRYGSVVAVSTAVMMVGCGYSDSALMMQAENTKRSDAGYSAKIEMTKHLTAYLERANQGCGVKVEIINGTPVTSVKECIRLDDAMASVDKVEILKPAPVKDMLDSAGDFAMKTAGIIVPVAGFYYGYKNNQVNQDASVAINAANKTADTAMWNAYTGEFQNTTSTTSESDSTSSTSSTTSTTNTTANTTSTTSIPSVVVDANSTTIQ